METKNLLYFLSFSGNFNVLLRSRRTMSSGNRVSASLALLLISLMISVPLSGCTGNLVDDEYEISSKDNEEFDDVEINEGIDNTLSSYKKELLLN